VTSPTDDRVALERLSDRLRTVSDTALTRPRADLDGQSVGDAVHALCAWAAGTQGIVQPVPRLHPLASGDLLQVVGRDFLDWAGSDPTARSLDHWRLQVRRIRDAV
jgi:hypothetical protein